MENVKSVELAEHGKITSRQLAFLIVTVIVATADVLLPYFVAQQAKQDSWISVIIATVFSVFVAMGIVVLGMRYPGKTVIQYSVDILGKIPGKIVGILFIYYFLYVTYNVTKELGDLFVISFNPDSPVQIYFIVALAGCAYAVSKGLEVTARVNEMLLPIGLGILGFVAVANIQHMDMNNFLPILYNGFGQPLRGAFLIQAWLLEVIVILQLIPYVTNQKKLKVYIPLSIIVLGISLMFGVFTIAVFGPLTSKIMYPALEYVRMASLGMYIENLDISIMGVWIAGIFIKITFFYYCSVLAIAQFFNLKTYKTLIIPVGILILALTNTISEGGGFFTNTLHYIFPFYSISMGFILPLFLLAVSLIRKKTS